MPTWFKCSWLGALFCNDAGTINVLPFMVNLSMIVILWLNDQYAVAPSILQSSLSATQYIIWNIPKCSSSRVDSLISWTVIQSGMSLHDSCIYVYAHTSYFLISVL